MVTAGIEHVAFSARPAASSFSSLPVIAISESAAQELNLRDGQIVKAMVESTGKQLLLSGREFSTSIPLEALLRPGLALDLKYVNSIYGRYLLPAKALTSSSSEVSSAARDTGGVTGGSGLNPALGLSGLTVPLLVAKIGSATNNPASTLAAFLGGDGLRRVLGWASERPEISEVLKRLLPQSMKLVSPSIIADFLPYSGIFSEAHSRYSGKVKAQLDLKQIFFLLRESTKDLSRLEEIKAAISAIDTLQLEGIVAQDKRDVLLRFVIPFQSGDAVEVEIECASGEDAEAQKSWSVAIHTTDVELGQISAQAVLRGHLGLDITLWAERHKTVEIMEQGLAELEDEFKRYHLELVSINVIKGSGFRKGPKFGSGSGSLLNIQT
jgi:hypothetical protein